MGASIHKHTPSLTSIDSRGLPARALAYHRERIGAFATTKVDHQVFDAAGQLTEQWDSRLFELRPSEPCIQPNQRTYYSLLGQVLKTESVDGGRRVAFSNAAGLVLESWDGRGTHLHFQYELLRPLAVFDQMVIDGIKRCSQRFTYAGAGLEDSKHNRCGRLIRHDDDAGSLWHEQFGVQGQTKEERRQFLTALALPDWPESIAARNKLLEAVGDFDGKDLSVSYTTHWRHDALGAVDEQTDAVGHAQRFAVDVAGNPCAIYLDGVALLKSATYNASGQSTVERAGNDVISIAGYSDVDGQMCMLKSTSPNGKLLQDLQYEYDPVGNIERIDDLRQPLQWFNQKQVEAFSAYTYDTLYQLISGSGRENASQSIGPALPGVTTFGKADNNRCRYYTQHYTYDGGGNLTDLKHKVDGNVIIHRKMEVAPHSNRSLFREKEETPVDFAKGFDANGNQQFLAPGQVMHWDARNQLRQVTQVVREEPNGQDDDTEVYVYDGGGQRVRKVRRAKTRSAEQLTEVRYLPGLEIHTRPSGELLHVANAQAGRNGVRLLHWEARKPDAIDNDQMRYGLIDHLESSTLELNQNAELITQENYYPFGGTAWWAGRSAIEVKYKIVRYSGKERDATGLYYYGFRYYAPWLQRWINPDPAGNVDGMNVFAFVRNNPINFKDSNGLTRTAAGKWKSAIAGVRDKLRNYDAIEIHNWKNKGSEVIHRGPEGMPAEMADKLHRILGSAIGSLNKAVERTQGNPSSLTAFTKATLKDLYGADFLEPYDMFAAAAVSELNTTLKKTREYLIQHQKDAAKNITIVSNSKKSNAIDLAFVYKEDKAKRIFIHQEAIEKIHDLQLENALVHESSHVAVDTYDMWYLNSHLPKSASNDEVKQYIDTAMDKSRLITETGPDEEEMPKPELYKKLLEKLVGPPLSSIEDRKTAFVDSPWARPSIVNRNADSLAAFVLKHR